MTTTRSPFMFQPGDMGEFEQEQVGVDAVGNPVFARQCIRPPLYTGGRNADGTATRARKPML
ncbi:hypothetical protein ACVIGA_003453 [Bradyrhizobium sp. USDA 3240]